MIRKLQKHEIQEKRKYIATLRHKRYYKYYFNGSSEKEPIEGYMIGDSYYIDFTQYDGLTWVGCIKLGDTTVSAHEFIKLLKRRIKKYKTLWMWADIRNTQSIRFHNVLISKYGCKRTYIQGKSIIKITDREMVKDV